MIVRLNSLYSWAAFQAADSSLKMQQKIQRSKGKHYICTILPEKELRENFLRGYQRENIVRQVFGVEPKDRYDFGNDVFYKGRWYEIKPMMEHYGFSFSIRQIQHSGFIIVRDIKPQTYELFWYCSVSNAFKGEAKREKHKGSTGTLIYVKKEVLIPHLDNDGKRCILEETNISSD